MASKVLTILPNGHAREDGKPLKRGTLDKYRLVVACVRGNVSVQETIRVLLKDALGPYEGLPTLVLGPTSPEEFENRSGKRIGWVTFVDGMSHTSPEVEIISPDNLLEVNLFIEKSAQGDEAPLILGDFLDNVIKSSGSSESFYSFFCQLASRLRMKKRTAILVIKEDIHDRPVVEIVKRFADVVLEFRDREDEGALSVVMRTLNFADNIYTGWVPFPEGLKPVDLGS